MNPIPYGRQYIDKDDEAAVVAALHSDFMTQGPKIGEFEQKFAAYVGAKYAVAVANGTAALHLSSLSIDLQPGDKIITTPITFAATANGSKYCGAEVVFCDIDKKTYTLDLDQLEELLKGSVIGAYKAVIPVDFAGYPCDMERLSQLSKAYKFRIIEDACHAPGGYFIDSNEEVNYCGNGKYADLCVFSFHPVKHIACGEGGMITTNDEDLYKKLLLLRTHGITKNPDVLEENHGGWYYEMHELGFNYRLTDLQAALGITQLAKLDGSIAKRYEIAVKYDEAFSGTEIKIPFRENDIQHAFHLYIIQVEDRKGLYEHLRSNNIFAQVHYVPVHLMPYYSSIKEYTMPVAEAYYHKCLSLPMYPTLTDEEQEFVIQNVLEFIQ